MFQGTSVITQFIFIGLLAILVSNKTDAAPVLVSDQIIPGGKPLIYNDRMWFSANLANFGVELFSSDGTTAGTDLFLDVEPGTGSSGAMPKIIYNNELYFTANTTSSGLELWKTNGTLAGTSVIETFAGATGFNALANFIVYNNILYFEGRSATNGSEIWRTDGTASGTFLVKDILVGTANGGFNHPAVYNGLLYFAASNGRFGLGKGLELWRTNGTNTGTVLFADIRPGNDGSGPSGLVEWAGFLYFACNDGVIGLELCRTDGSTAGVIADIRPGGSFSSSSPAGFIQSSTHLFFHIFSGSDTELWSVTNSNLISRAQDNLGNAPQHKVLLNDELIYESSGGIFRSNGMTDGGVSVTPENGSITSARNFATSNGRVYLSGVYFFSNTTGFELMRTDGTNPGTTIMADIQPGAGANSFPSNLFDFNDTLYFSALQGGVNKWFRFVEQAGQIAFDQSTQSVSEDGVQVDINVSRLNGTDGYARVRVITSDDSAQAGNDYTAVNQLLTWQPGISGPRQLSVLITDDMLSEGLESFVVNLSEVGGASLGATTQITININDDDIPLVANGDAYTLDEDNHLVAEDADGDTTIGNLNDDGVLANDTGSGTLNVTTTGTIIGQGLGGTVTMAADGTFSYSPPENVFGTDRFDYTMDNGNTMQTATVTLSVNPINDAPVFVPGPSQAFVAGTTGTQTISNWVQSVDLGPNENDQNILDYNIASINDPNGLLNSIDVLNSGTLELDLSGNSGAASVDITLIDDGGTTNPGDEDTSEVQTLFISLDQSSDLAISAVQCDTITGPGFTHDYSLTISNDGPDTTSEVIVEISISGQINQASLTSDSAQTDCMTVTDGLLCTLTMPIQNGLADGLDFQVLLDGAATQDLSVSAEVTGLQSDNNPSNNTVNLTTQLIETLIDTDGFESCSQQ